jgi:hypothetical protein
VNNLAPYLAALAGVPLASILGGQPTNVDLTAFGQRVFSLEQTRALLSAANTWTAGQLIPGQLNAVPAGYPGERYTFQTPRTSGVSLTTGTGKTVLTFTVPSAGLWYVSARAGISGASGTTGTYCNMQLSTVANSLSNPLGGFASGNDGPNFYSGASNNFSNGDYGGGMGAQYILTTAAATYYLVAVCGFSGGTVDIERYV